MGRDLLSEISMWHERVPLASTALRISPRISFLSHRTLWGSWHELNSGMNVDVLGEMSTQTV